MVAASDFTIPFKEHQKTQVEVISHISNDLQAPINQGEKVGWLEIVCDGVSIGEVDIISENDIYGVSNIRSVSYTHLDVYKRQVYGRQCFEIIKQGTHKKRCY